MDALLLSAGVAAIVSAGVAWGFESIRAWIDRPRLALETWECHDAKGRRYFYLKVTNSGKTTARGCVGQVTVIPVNLKKVLPGSLVTEWPPKGLNQAGLVNAALSWQRADQPIAVDIYAGQSQRLEFAAGKIRKPEERDAQTRDFGPPGEDETVFILPTETGYTQTRMVFIGVGFFFRATIGSDNASPVSICGYLKKPPGNPQPTMEILKELPKESALAEITRGNP